jgi:SlyX protein
VTEENHPLANRIVDLEIRYTHQERLIEELNQVVIAQSKVLTRLQEELEALRTRVLSREDAVPHERPPHY